MGASIEVEVLEISPKDFVWRVLYGNKVLRQGLCSDVDAAWEEGERAAIERANKLILPVKDDELAIRAALANSAPPERTQP